MRKWGIILAIVVLSCKAKGGVDYQGVALSEEVRKQDTVGTNQPDTDTVDFGQSVSDGETKPTQPEEKNLFLAPPISTEKYVIVPISSLNVLVRISVDDLSIRVIPVGKNPQLIAAVGKKAVSWNQGEDTISVVDVDSAREVKRISIEKFSSSTRIATDGKYVILYQDIKGAGSDLRNPGRIMIYSSDDDSVKFFSVAPGIKNIVFASGTAYIVSEKALTIVPLSSPENLEIIPFSTSATEDYIGDEVEISGNFAFVLRIGKDVISINLNTGEIKQIEIPGGNPTDIHIIMGGSHKGRLLVVSRGSFSEGTPSILSEFYLSESSGEWELSTTYTTEIEVGQVVELSSGSKFILFSSVSEYPFIGFIDLNLSSRISVYKLVKPVLSVVPAESGDFAIAVHHKENPVAKTDTEKFFKGKEAVSSIVIKKFLSATPISVPAKPTDIITTYDGKYALLKFPGNPDILIIDVDNRTDFSFKLSSEPLFVGSIPNKDILFALQSHRLSKITFFEFSEPLTGETIISKKEISGFLLNTRVVEK